jgi:hypothetical protein
MTRTLLALAATLAFATLASAQDDRRGRLGIKGALEGGKAGWSKPICVGGRCYPPGAKFSLQRRAELIAKLRSGRLDSKAQESLAGLLIGAEGEELTRLKRLVEAKGGLHSLVYSEISDEGLRKQVLDHFAAEAKAAPSKEVKVLSGVVNTIMSLESDPRYPDRTVYPGVRAFYKALDEGTGGPGAGGRPGDINFFTGQPALSAGILRRKLDAAGLEGPMLKASILDLRSNAAGAKRKLRNVEEVRALYPEYGHVYTGDSGAVDHLVAKRLYGRNPRGLKGTFIHDVTGIDLGTRERLENFDVMVFDNYAQAARLAYERGLIDRQALERVAKATQRELREVRFRKEKQRFARQAELRRELRLIADLPKE